MGRGGVLSCMAGIENRKELRAIEEVKRGTNQKIFLVAHPRREWGHSALRTLVSCISRVRPLPLRPRPFLPNFLSLFEKCIVPSALLSAAANAPLCLEVEGVGVEG